MSRYSLVLLTICFSAITLAGNQHIYSSTMSQSDRLRYSTDYHFYSTSNKRLNSYGSYGALRSAAIDMGGNHGARVYAQTSVFSNMPRVRSVAAGSRFADNNIYEVGSTLAGFKPLINRGNPPPGEQEDDKQLPISDGIATMLIFSAIYIIKRTLHNETCGVFF